MIAHFLRATLLLLATAATSIDATRLEPLGGADSSSRAGERTWSSSSHGLSEQRDKDESTTSTAARPELQHVGAVRYLSQQQEAMTGQAGATAGGTGPRKRRHHRASSRSGATSALTEGRRPRLRLAIVNSVTFHLEIVMGVLFVLEGLDVDKTVFLANGSLPGGLHNYDFHHLISPQYAGRLQLLPTVRTPADRAAVQQQDVMIFISPEYNLNYVKKLIESARPRHVLAFVHSADPRDDGLLPQLAPSIRLLTLSPHVRENLRRMRGYESTFVLPTAELALGNAASGGGDGRLGGRLVGFGVPGSIKFLRRDYVTLWSEMATHFDADPRLAQDERVHIHIVGTGNFNMSRLPPQVAGRWHVHIKLKYPAFYHLLHGMYALLPLFASETYVTTKFSATIAAMLTTGVPLVATEQVMHAYSFLPRAAVFLQPNGTGVVDVLVGVLGMRAAERLSVRVAVKQLQRRLNAQATDTFRTLIVAP